MMVCWSEGSISCIFSISSPLLVCGFYDLVDVGHDGVLVRGIH